MRGHGTLPGGILFFVERLWSSVKYERFYLDIYDSVFQARISIIDYFDWYNHKRHYSSLNRKAPHPLYSNLLPVITIAT